MNFIKHVQHFINDFKVLTMNVWNHVNAIDENFSTKFIFMFNVGFSSTTQFSRWMSGSLNDIKFASLKGSFADSLPADTKLFLPLLAGINIAILVIGGLSIIKQKIKNRDRINPVMNVPKFNNVAYNKPLLNTRHAFTLMLIFTINLIVFCTSLKNSPHKIDGIYIVLLQIFIFIIFPIYVIFRRITFTKFILREIKNF